MKGKTRYAMWRNLFAARITVIAVLLLCQSCHAAQESTKKTTLDPGTVEMLSNILESLDTFRNDRLRDLEKIRLSTPPGNGTAVSRLGEVSTMPQNSSVSEHIKALKEGIMGHNPVKKTFGYKVTVYTSPIGEDGKDSKPVLVTQYVGGDMKPDTPVRRADESEDLEESGNHPERHVVHTSESAHLPFQVSVSNAGGEGHESSATGGSTDHNRKTEHSASSEKGHQNGHSLHTQLAKGHDHEKHSAKHDEHHKETEKESHRHDTQAHDKGGASQQGIRERTEIEYYEREHFLDTEYDKAKTGHDKTSGVKEHESHNDHDSHEDKKVHAKDNSYREKFETGGSVGKSLAAGKVVAIDAHYTPPLPPVHYHEHPHVVHEDSVHEDSHDLKEDEGSSRLHHSEESKGHREHNSEKDRHSEEKDQGYLDKDKGRRKEGYRERGYKITAEREYFLNDAHHDKGHASHVSGSKLKDQEGAAHGTKEGERDRGFVKEEKKEEAHDAAYDAKERKFYDGEAHSEGFTSEKAASSAGGQEKQQEEVVPLAPPVVNYDEYSSHPHYPLPIVYSPSNAGAQPVVAYPPSNLTPKPPKAAELNGLPAYQDRTNHNGKETASRKQQQQPLGGYDDDRDDLGKNGYVGHASYKKRAPSPLIAAIKDTVRKDVHAKPPSYAKSEESSSDDSPPSSENSVRFPERNEDDQQRYTEKNENESGEVTFPRGQEKSYSVPPKYRKEPEEYKEKKVLNQQLESPILNVPQQHRQYSEKDLSYLEDQKRKEAAEKLNHNVQLHRPNLEHHRHTDPRSLYVQGAQDADKLIRSAYPQIQSGTIPTVGQLIQEIVRSPQGQEGQRYPHPPQRNANDNTELAYADLHRIYNLNPETHGHRRPQQNYRSPEPAVRTHQQPSHQGGQNHNHHLQAGRYNHLLQNNQQLPQPGEASLEQSLLNLQQQQQHQRTISALEQLQQQTKPPFSPVVLLSRGPPAQRQNQAVDVWYTRPRS